MTTDETTNGELPGTSNVLDFDKFKQEKQLELPHAFPTQPENSTGVNKKPSQVPQQLKNPNQRKLIISLADGNTVEIEGSVGLSGSFLAVGDPDGYIKFAAASGYWLAVTDVTGRVQPISNDNDSPPESA